MYISQWDVAHLAQELSGSQAPIEGSQTAPKNQIENRKLCQLGMQFGGAALLQQTIEEILQSIQSH